MTFLPARMSRLLVGGHQQHLEAVIDELHAEGAVHIEDYADPTGTTRIGTPLPAGEAASESLVAVRGLQKALGCEDVRSAPADPDPAGTLHAAEAATRTAVESAHELRANLSALDAEETALVPLSGLDADLAALGSLRSVKVYLGLCRSDPTARVAETGASHDLQVAPSGGAFAILLAVAPAGAPACEKALAECGFQATNLPAGRAGTAAERLAAIQAERARITAELADDDARLSTLRAEWGPRLAASEHALAVAVEKTQAPLRFGVTGTTFHIEGWVPRNQLARVESALKQRFGEQLYLHELGDAPSHDGQHSAPGLDHGHAPAALAHPVGDGAIAGDHGHTGPTPAEEPPIHLENQGPARPYEFFLGLLAKPRYREIDPTKLMLIFFPLFFGLMVGDLAIGVLIMLVGLFLKKNKVFGIGGPAVGRALWMGGLMSALVGLFIFGEALGIHFVVSHEAATVEHEISWEQILGVEFPQSGFLHKVVLPDHHEAAFPHPTGGTHLRLGEIANLGYYSKVHDTLSLLIWAIIIGVIHVVLGLLIGIRNVYVQHGPKLAIQEKVAWLTLMAGTAMGVLLWGGILGYLGVAVAVGSVALLWMGAAHTIGVGFIALLEVPGLAGNILSYTRLAAIGASKAGMAVAFASIAFETIGGGNLHSILGWMFYLVGSGLILVLAVIAGTLQSLRLQFVEFFGKFYTGGGRPYVPFGRRAA